MAAELDIWKKRPMCPHCGNTDRGKLRVHAQHTEINGRKGAIWNGSWRCLACHKTIKPGGIIDAAKETDGDATET